MKDDLGLADAVDDKASDSAEELKRALPNGLDTLFDSVGGHMLAYEAADLGLLIRAAGSALPSYNAT